MEIILAVTLVLMFLTLLFVQPARTQLLNFIALLGRLVWAGILGVVYVITLIFGRAAAPFATWVLAQRAAAWGRIRIVGGTAAGILITLITLLVAAWKYNNSELFAAMLIILSVLPLILFWVVNGVAGTGVGRWLGVDKAYGLGLLIEFMWFLAAFSLLFPAGLHPLFGKAMMATLLVAALFSIIGKLRTGVPVAGAPGATATAGTAVRMVPHWTLAIAGVLMLLYSFGTVWIVQNFPTEVRFLSALHSVWDSGRNRDSAELEASAQTTEAIAKNEGLFYTGSDPVYDQVTKKWVVNNLQYHEEDGVKVKYNPGTKLLVWTFDSPVYSTGPGTEPVLMVAPMDQTEERVVRTQRRYVAAKKFWLVGPDEDGGSQGASGAQGSVGVSSSRPTQVASCPSPSWAGTVLQYPACHPGWYAIGNEDTILYVSGEINHGGKKATPLGSEMNRLTKREWNDLTDGLPLAAFVAKVGNDGKPFVVQNGQQISAGGHTIYVGINDSNYSDNSGAFVVQRK